MPQASLDNVELFYEWSGDPGSSVLVLLNSLGTDLHLWDAVAPALGEHYRLLRCDTRGHGRSSVPPGAYTLDLLTNDVLHLLDSLSVETAALCGVSLGGLTALSLAINAPARFTGIIAANTAARIGTSERWIERIAKVNNAGLAAIAGETLTRWFTPGFLQEHPDVVEPVRATFAATSPRGYTACCAALRDADLRSRLHEIEVRTLLIAGTADYVTPPSDMLFLRDRIDASHMVELPGAHLTVIENAAAFAEAVLAFLAKD